MNFKSLLIAAAFAGAVGTAATAQTVTLVPVAPGLFTGDFTQPVEGLFTDTFSFIPARFAGHVSVILSSLTGPVSFFTASLNGQDFSFFPGPQPMDFAFEADVLADVSLTLTVFGAVLDGAGNPGGAGSYRGVITAVAAVPEPQTWALMLGGIGLALGAAAKRRRETVDV